MTPRRAQDRFDDVLEVTSCARTIVERRRATFDADIVVQLAGERVVELVAEAVSVVVGELETSYPDFPWHEPVGMRNVLAHEYWRTDPDLVSTALADDIPEVADMVRAVRDELGD